MLDWMKHELQSILQGEISITSDMQINDPDNHDGVITDLEPDILECEVKWALEA